MSLYIFIIYINKTIKMSNLYNNISTFRYKPKPIYKPVTALLIQKMIRYKWGSTVGLFLVTFLYNF
jgi:hypothetical protein